MSKKPSNYWSKVVNTLLNKNKKVLTTFFFL
ncbi:hypothetical protein B23_1802 [Geobacillus thermoleovorans B23]|nr:hypothetical protein B23_1802 [Geobacillus thermoleovorans B23]